MSGMNVGAFVDALEAVFRINKDVAESEVSKRAWAMTMTRQLSKFASRPDVLERACDEIMDKHKGPYFPTPAACLEACREAERWLGIEKAKKEGKPPPTADAQIDDYGNGFANKKILEDPLGKQAAREDWHTVLHEFIAKHRRMPVGPEIARLKAEAQDTLKNFIEPAIRDAHKGAVQGVVAKAAVTMLERRKKLAERILGGLR